MALMIWAVVMTVAFLASLIWGALADNAKDELTRKLAMAKADHARSDKAHKGCIDRYHELRDKSDAQEKLVTAVTNRLREQIAFELYLGDLLEAMEERATAIWTAMREGKSSHQPPTVSLPVYADYLARADKILCAAEGPVTV